MISAVSHSSSACREARTNPPAKNTRNPVPRTPATPYRRMASTRLSPGMKTKAPIVATRNGMDSDVTVPGFVVSASSATDRIPNSSAVDSKPNSSIFPNVSPACHTSSAHDHPSITLLSPSLQRRANRQTRRNSEPSFAPVWGTRCGRDSMGMQIEVLFEDVDGRVLLVFRKHSVSEEPLHHTRAHESVPYGGTVNDLRPILVQCIELHARRRVTGHRIRTRTDLSPSWERRSIASTALRLFAVWKRP